MAYFLPCRLCVGNKLLCSPQCLSAPFFPLHMVFETEQVNFVFTTSYILTSLLFLQNNHPQPSSSILFMKNLVREAHLRFADPIDGPFQALRVLARRLANKVSEQDAEIKQLRRELNVRRAQGELVLSVGEGSENSGQLLPPPPL